MARTRNAVESRVVQISTTPQVFQMLEALARTGRFGKNASEVAEEALRTRLRELELEGWIDRGASTKKRGPARGR